MTNPEPDLKKVLKKKKRILRELKDQSKKKIKKEIKKIDKKAEQKIKKVDKKLTGKLTEIENKHEESLKTLEKKQKTLEKIHDEKATEVLQTQEKVHKEIVKEAEKAKQEVIELTEKEIRHARKEFLSVKARVYSRRRKILNALQFLGVLYLFVLAVIIMKNSAFALSNGAVDTISSTIDGPLSAFGAGWLGAFIAQSASVIAILANTLVGSGVIDFNTALYILLGLTLGNAITPILASLVIKTKYHWDLRHGFELGLANVVYAIFLVLLLVLIQLTTGLFTVVGESVNTWAEGMPVLAKVPSLLDVITDPVIWFFRIDQAPIWVGFLIGLFLLLFSLRRVGQSMFVFLGGKRHTRALIEKHLGTCTKGFLLGLGLTIIIPSASVLVTLMVPLAITRIVTLRQAIPYLIGTNVGTFIDVLLAAFANAQGYAIAGGVVLTLMSAFGAFFVIKGFGCNVIYKITRYVAIHKMVTRKSSIVKFVVCFACIPLFIVLISTLLPI